MSHVAQDTEKLLVRDGATDGWFLVRQSTKEKNVFVISLCFKGRLFHNQVCSSSLPFRFHTARRLHTRTASTTWKARA